VKILIDECLPKIIKNFFINYEVWTTQDLKISGYKNGDLIKYAEENNFSCIITIDSGIIFQQNLENLSVAIITLRSKTNRIDDLRKLENKIIEVLKNIEKGKVYIVE